MKESIYNTFKGGFVFECYDNNRKPSNIWQYVCFYSMIRICKGTLNGELIIPGVAYSLHFNTYANRGPKWLPNYLRNKASNHHIVFIKKFPFIVIGFKNVSKYIKWFN